MPFLPQRISITWLEIPKSISLKSKQEKKLLVENTGGTPEAPTHFRQQRVDLD